VQEAQPRQVAQRRRQAQPAGHDDDEPQHVPLVGEVAAAPPRAHRDRPHEHLECEQDGEGDAAARQHPVAQGRPVVVGRVVRAQDDRVDDDDQRKHAVEPRRLHRSDARAADRVPCAEASKRVVRHLVVADEDARPLGGLG